jgi:hypothetical protein
MIKIELTMTNGDQRTIECYGYSVDQAFFRAQITGGQIILAMDKIVSVFIPEAPPAEPQSQQAVIS